MVIKSTPKPKNVSEETKPRPETRPRKATRSVKSADVINHDQYKDIVKKSVILSRINTQTSSELRRKLSEIFKNSGDENYPVHVFISAPDFALFSKSGFQGIKAGSNSITMLEAKVLVVELKHKHGRYTNPKNAAKFAKAINRVMTAFGPGFVKEMGGYAPVKEPEAVLIKR
jgi:hypothetical protein